MQIKMTLEEGVQLPKYATPGSAGFDLAVHSFEELIGPTNYVESIKPETTSIFLPPLARLKIGTGIRMAIPKDYQLEIRSRSGISFKSGIIVVNQPGTIDSDYRGEIIIVLMNISSSPLEIKMGQAIAQAVLMPAPQAEFDVVKDLDETERGDGGFGSTTTPENSGFYVFEISRALKVLHNLDPKDLKNIVSEIVPLIGNKYLPLCPPESKLPSNIYGIDRDGFLYRFIRISAPTVDDRITRQITAKWIKTGIKIN